MSQTVESILRELRRVADERERRRRDAALLRRVLEVKAYQQRRFCHTYADLLVHPRYTLASRFFLDELYGPMDFTQRDEQFARVVPALVRLFPQDIVDTVGTLAALHALSEQLDTQMAEHAADATLTQATYLSAWQATGRPLDREQQIVLTQRVGERLDRLTRNPVLRHTLRMMRGPAKASGLSDLQRFLERGFDTFKAMRGADEFMAMIGTRERQLAQALFEMPPPGNEAGSSASGLLPSDPS